MPDVFISYKKEDQDRVGPIARALAEAGYEVWWDHRIPPGRSYRDVIGAALENAKCVLVVWSTLSVGGQWVLDEADAGKKRGVLLPILIDPVDIPFGFRQLEAANLTGWGGDRQHPEWIGALEAVAHFVGRPPGGPAKPFTTPSAAPVASPPPEPPPAKSGPNVALFGLIGLLVLAGGAFTAWQAGLFGQGAQVSADAPDAPDETSTATEQGGSALPTERVLSIQTAEGFLVRRVSDEAYIVFDTEGFPVTRLDITAEMEGVTTGVDRVTGLSGWLDATNRNVRSQQDDGSVTTETNFKDFQIGLFSAPAKRPAMDSTIIWFAGGGALALRNGVWIEAFGEENERNGHTWKEIQRTADTLVLQGVNRDAKARIKFTEGEIELWFPDWNEWRLMWKIRAVDAVAWGG